MRKVAAGLFVSLDKDGKKPGGSIATPPSEAGASGAGRTVDMPTDAPTNNRKLPEQQD